MTRNIGILGAMAQEIDEVKALLTEKTIVKIANREFVVPKEEYAGVLPELSCGEGELIAEPSFKPDAKVKMIRLINTVF